MPKTDNREFLDVELVGKPKAYVKIWDDIMSKKRAYDTACKASVDFFTTYHRQAGDIGGDLVVKAARYGWNKPSLEISPAVAAKKKRTV